MNFDSRPTHVPLTEIGGIDWAKQRTRWPHGGIALGCHSSVAGLKHENHFYLSEKSHEIIDQLLGMRGEYTVRSIVVLD
jgi:hypothetical protein